jgi:hypothetical protein
VELTHEGTRQAFVFEGIAVLVGPWREPMDPPERGARVEVRLLEDQPRRGTRFAAQRIVIDQPLFRADLFDQVDKPPGNLASAHFHTHFDGAEPCDRVWSDDLSADPIKWLAQELDDLNGLIKRAGIEVADAPWIDTDAEALRRVIPAILTAVQATWDDVRAESLSG